MTEGVDYAGAHPDPHQLAKAGKRFVIRYGGPGGSWKHLTAAEAQALTRAGLWLVANAEGTATGLRGGRSAGADWARSAEQHFRALGMPADRPIYLSADWDVTSAEWPQVAEALRGAASVIGPARVGVYGPYHVMQWAARDRVARWFWQTYAWSRAKSGQVQWYAGNHLEQYRNGVSLAGGTVDLCRAKKDDFGQWGESDVTPEELLAYDPNTKGKGIPNPFHDADKNPTISVRTALYNAVLIPMRLQSALNALNAQVAQLAGRDLVDEPAIVAGVLAGLTPQAIAAAIPPTVARQVVDELVARLGGPDAPAQG